MTKEYIPVLTANKLMTEEELRNRLTPNHKTQKAIEDAKNKVIDLALDKSISYTTKGLSNNAFVQQLADFLIKQPLEAIKEATHESTRFQWGPSRMDSVDRALPQYRDEAIQKLAMQIAIEDSLTKFSPTLPNVVLIDLPNNSSEASKKETVKENLKKVGLTDKQAKNSITAIEDKNEKNTQKALAEVNQLLVVTYQKIEIQEKQAAITQASGSRSNETYLNLKLLLSKA